MKTYLTTLLLLASLLSACVQKKNGWPKSDEIVQAPVEEKTTDTTAIDYVTNGMQDLGTSGKMKDIICQNWDYYEDMKDAKNIDPSSTMEVVYRGYCIFSDGTMLKDPRGNIRMGKWRIDDKTKPITINFFLEGGETETYQLAYLMPYEMKLVPKDGEKKDIIDLRGEGLRYLDTKKDPFSISNNFWRFKPLHSETDEQIKARLKGCIHFFVLFYEHNLNAHTETVLFTGLPSCFKWYGGAIYLQRERELDHKWLNSFYDIDEGMKAYKLAGKLMSKQFDWPKNESNWLKLNLAVLKQMEGRVGTLSL